MEMGVVRNGSELRRLEDTAVLCFFSHLAENTNDINWNTLFVHH